MSAVMRQRNWYTNLRSYRHPLIKLHQMICFLFGRGQSQGKPRGQGQVTPLMSRVNIGGQMAYQSIRELSVSTTMTISAL